jgi:glucokinase
MELFLGIDCGGTHLRVGLVDSSGQLLTWKKIHSPLKNQSNDFGAIVHQVTSELLSQSQFNLRQIKAIGVGVPGPLDIQTGHILQSPNLANSEPISVVSQLETSFNLPAYLDRDTNIGLLGEQWLGAARNNQQVIMLTLGTGIGGAILLNGQLYRGHHGRAGEIGHTYIGLVDPHQESVDIPKCGLGHSGCFEAIFKHSEFSQLPFYLGKGLASVIDIFDPEIIILGGGMMSALDKHLPAIQQEMISSSVTKLASQTELVSAQLGDIAGIYGAAKLAKDIFQ